MSGGSYRSPNPQPTTHNPHPRTPYNAPMNFVWFGVIGLAAGMLAGVFGVGGGIIMVPAMVLLLGFSQHKAQGTSLAVLSMPVVAAAAYTYWKQSNVDILGAVVMGACLVVGGILGSKFAVGLDPVIMRKSFAVFMVCVAVYMFFKP